MNFRFCKIKYQIIIVLRWNISSSATLPNLWEKGGYDVTYRGKITICHVTFNVNSVGEIFTSTVWKHSTVMNSVVFTQEYLHLTLFRWHKLGIWRILKSINVNMLQNCSCCITVSPLCDHGLRVEVNTTSQSG
jgi:hypothetical protein